MQSRTHSTDPSATASADLTGPAMPLGPGRLGIYDAPVDVPAIDIPAHLAAQSAQIAELRAQVECLRAERDRLADRQRQIAEVLKSPNPDKVLHDLRNVLNELQLYKMLADTQG